MLTGITRNPPHSITECELTFVDRTLFDFDLACSQHSAYTAALTDLGVNVIALPVDESLPDSAFVEDTALVLPEIAIVLSLGVPSRQAEIESIRGVLKNHREIREIERPALIEGGDILTIRKTLYVGLSTRTNEKGVSALETIVKPLGYTVIPIEVRGSLHLKTACTVLDSDTILLNRDWVNLDVFEGFRIFEVDDGEPFAANALRIGKTVLMHSGFVKTIERVRTAGFEVETTDISEFLKAEAGLTCLSLIFEP